MVIISLHTYAVLITSQAGFFLGSSFYLDAFTQDFDQGMQQLNNFVNGFTKPRVYRSDVQTQLANAVKFNIEILEFVLCRIIKITI